MIQHSKRFQVTCFNYNKFWNIKLKYVSFTYTSIRPLLSPHSILNIKNIKYNIKKPGCQRGMKSLSFTRNSSTTSQYSTELTENCSRTLGDTRPPGWESLL